MLFRPEGPTQYAPTQERWNKSSSDKCFGPPGLLVFVNPVRCLTAPAGDILALRAKKTSPLRLVVKQQGKGMAFGQKEKKELFSG